MPEPKMHCNIYRRYTLPLILFLAFCIRVSFLHTAEKIPFNYIADSQMHANNALRIIEKKPLEPVWHQGPLYPYFLAEICSVAGKRSMYPVLFVQMLLGLGSIFLVYIITMRVSGSWITAILAALLLAVYQPMIFYEEMILMESLLSFLYLAALVSIISAEQSGKRRWWFAAGLILGIAALGRGSILLFGILIIIVKGCLIATRHPVVGKKKRYIGLLLFAVGMAIAICPLSIRNLISAKEFVPLAANYGITFYEGNNRFARGIYMDPPGLNLDQDFTGEKIGSVIAGRSLTPSKTSQFWTNEAWNDITASPFHFIRLLGLKAAYYWNRAEIPNAESYLLAKQFSPLFSFSFIGFTVAALFGLIGIGYSLWQRRKTVLTPLLFIAAHMASVVMFFITARYRISVVPVLLIFTAMAIVSIIEAARRKHFKRLAAYGIGLCCSAILVFFPWRGISDNYLLAYSHNNMGLLNFANGNIDAARQLYESAIHECPMFWKPYNNLGNLYLAIGQKEKALQLYRQGLQEGTSDDSCAMIIHVSIGTFYLKEGNVEEARNHYSQALPYARYSLMLRQLHGKLSIRDGVY